MIGSKTTRSSRAPWVIIAGGVNRLGGTDKANIALAEHLLDRDHVVHVVTHRIDESLKQHVNIRVQIVPVPVGSWFAGERLLAFRGHQLAKTVRKEHPHARIVVNGGNCVWQDINWVHRVHHAWSPDRVDAPLIHRVKHRLAVASAKSRELRGISAARLIIANSKLTKGHLIEFLGLDSERIHVIHLGSESDWRPAEDGERTDARARLSHAPSRPLVVFVGAVGYDKNKGLDTLLSAWSQLCRHPQWDADLLIAGDGRALPDWQRTVAQSEFKQRVRFLGFTDRIPELLAAADLLVSPVRYESYGLNVQEALCRGVPAIVSATAGVAERYPLHLRQLLLPNPENVDDVAARMLMWRTNIEYWRTQVVHFSHELRSYSWQDMAARFYDVSESTYVSSPEAISNGVA